MNKKIFAQGLITVLFLTGCQQPAGSPSPTQQAATTQQSAVSLQVNPPVGFETQQNLPAGTFQTNSLKDDNKFYKVNVVYPVTGNAVVDKKIYAMIKEQVDPFMQDVPKTAEEATPGPWTLDISYHTTSFSDDVMSFIFVVDNYTGGAHGNQFTVTQTFNMKTGEEITLNKVFFPDSGYVQAISEKTKSELKKTFGQDVVTEMLDAGTSPDPKNFASFSLLPDQITFYFDPYAVAPYAAGPQQVTLQLADFDDMLQPAFGGKAQGPKGTIEGSMGYPSEGIPPAIIVCADNLSTHVTVCTDKRITDKKYKYGTGYKLQVSPGDYYVYEKISTGKLGDFDGTYKAYYSDFVVCGESVDCKSHKPIKVTVKEGSVAFDIEPTDWYV